MTQAGLFCIFIQKFEWHCKYDERIGSLGAYHEIHVLRNTSIHYKICLACLAFLSKKFIDVVNRRLPLIIALYTYLPRSASIPLTQILALRLHKVLKILVRLHRLERMSFKGCSRITKCRPYRPMTISDDITLWKFINKFEVIGQRWPILKYLLSIGSI